MITLTKNSEVFDIQSIIDNCEQCQDPQGYLQGSHYHCIKCGEVTGMYGHSKYNAISKVTTWSCEEK